MASPYRLKAMGGLQPAGLAPQSPLVRCPARFLTPSRDAVDPLFLDGLHGKRCAGSPTLPAFLLDIPSLSHPPSLDDHG
ncbi:hypothetical protein QYE76_030611 [Lolium multiflorum]|uniref:Uncharacterized protein n=1 Tax=Lolium multiflorum TaxID=4521 RepID=A0AAD8QQ17_LOLMU|nr:hypothetical protein QYE76_030611 [Lolium multiflorum]